MVDPQLFLSALDALISFVTDPMCQIREKIKIIKFKRVTNCFFFSFSIQRPNCSKKFSNVCVRSSMFNFIEVPKITPVKCTRLVSRRTTLWSHWSLNDRLCSTIKKTCFNFVKLSNWEFPEKKLRFFLDNFSFRLIEEKFKSKNIGSSKNVRELREQRTAFKDHRNIRFLNGRISAVRFDFSLQLKPEVRY